MKTQTKFTIQFQEVKSDQTNIMNGLYTKITGCFRVSNSIMKFILLITILFNYQLSSSQTPTNFYEVQNYYHDPVRYIPSEGEDEGGPNAYMEKLNKTWGLRLYPHGDIGVAAAAYLDYVENFFDGEYETYPIDWAFEGPEGSNISGKPWAGRMNRITFDPYYGQVYEGVEIWTLYTCSSHGGLWRSDDRGENWYNLNTDTQLPMCSAGDVAVCKQNRDILYLATGLADDALPAQLSQSLWAINPIYTTGVYRSIDGGLTWQQANGNLLESFEDGGTIRRIMASPIDNNIVWIATSKGVWKTENALSNNEDVIWDLVIEDGFPVNTENNFRGLELHPTNSDIVYVSGDAVWKSIDGGTSFANISGNVTGWDQMDIDEPSFQLSQINIAVTPASGAENWIYAYVIGSVDYVCDGNELRQPKAFICIYNGINWKSVYEFVTPLYSNCAQNTYFVISPTWNAIAVHPVNPDIISFGYTTVMGTSDPNASITSILSTNTDIVFTSFGSYSTSTSNHADCHDLKFEPHTTLITDPDLWQAHDGGISLKQSDWNTEVGWVRRLKGLDAMTIWSFDDSDKQSDSYITSNQDNGVSIINQEIGLIDWYTKFVGDGYGSQISDQFDRYFYMGSIILYSNEIENYNVFTTEKIEGEVNSELGDLDLYSSPLDSQDPNNKADIGQTFKIKENFQTGETYVGWSEIYKRKKAKSDTSTDPTNPVDLWELASDVGENVDLSWKGNRIITEFEIGENDPNVVYVVTRGFLENGTIWPDDEITLHSHFFVCTEWDQLNINPGITFEDKSESLPEYYANGDITKALPTGIATNPENAAEVWLSFSGFAPDVKVYRSLNHGQNFQNMDPNGTLPNIPINGIVYQPGTDGRVFIATDAGVWMRDEGTEDWVKYGNIPNVRVLEIKINRCANEIRVCTFGRGLWSAALPPSRPSENFMVLNSSTPIIWSDDHYSNINIEISSGTQLQITGTLHMPFNGKIRVQPNAKLVINGGMITNSCGSLWQGIEVLGNENLQQTSTNQGTVEMMAGATIKNAIVGIHTISTDVDGNFDWSKTGGIVKVKDSNFINNKNAIVFRSYHNGPENNETSNVSYIRNCNFETNDSHYFDLNQHSAFVSLWDVNGVRIQGNRFENSLTPTLNYPTDRGYGIRSAMATYILNDHCTNVNYNCNGGTLVQNEFSGLAYAIRSSGPSTFNQLTIDHAKFTNNYRAVYLSGFGNAIVTRNDFNWAVLTPNSTYGLYLDNCTGYEVEENLLNGTDMQNSTGLIIRNSGEDPNRIYKNTFTNLNSATTILGLNDYSGDTDFTGLQITCNDYGIQGDVNGDNKYDIFLGKNASIADYQGNTTNQNPASNRFWAPASSGDLSEINLATNSFESSFEYITHDRTFSPETYPEDYSSEVGVLESNGLTYDANTCPSKFSKDKVKTITKELMVENHETHLLLKIIYDDYINNGASLDLKALILDPSVSSIVVKAALIGASPKVSDNLLIEAMHRSPSLTGWQIAQVLVANSPLRSTVLEEMKRMGYQPYYEQLVEGIQNGTINTKNMMEMDFAWYGSEKSQEETDLKRLIMASDENSDRWMELNAMRTEFDFFFSEADILAYYFDKSDLSTVYNLGQNADPNNDAIVLLNLANTLRLDGLNSTGLTSQQVSSLENIANSDKLSASTAAGILEYWNIFVYEEPIEEPVGKLRLSKSPLGVPELNWITLSPNPANELCQMTFRLPEFYELATMTIIDAMGRIVLSKDISAYLGIVEFDSSVIPNGSYSVLLTVDGVEFGTSKMIIQH